MIKLLLVKAYSPIVIHSGKLTSIKFFVALPKAPLGIEVISLFV